VDTTIQTFAYRTHLACHVYGHKNIETGEQFITLATEAPPILKVERTYQAVDRGGKSWP
jgi:hypothetical protein